MSISKEPLSLQEWVKISPENACLRLSRTGDCVHRGALKVSTEVYLRLDNPVEFAFFAKTCETMGVVGERLWESYRAVESDCDRLIKAIFEKQNKSQQTTFRSSL